MVRVRVRVRVKVRVRGRVTVYWGFRGKEGYFGTWLDRLGLGLGLAYREG